MDYQAMYQQKLTTAEEAVKVVKSGDWVDYGWCTNHPIALDKALAARKDELRDVKVRGGVTMWMPEIAKAEDAGEHFTWNSWHCSGIDRKIMTKGMGFFSPMRYSELPRFYRENLSVDVAMLQVTPMDSHGNFSFALAASHLADMLEKAKVIILEVNKNMPWVYGLTGCEINIKDVDYVVEGDNPEVAQLGGGGEPTAVDKAVAELIVPQIPNGACLQLGIGGMPNTIGAMIAQSDLKDLGVHTEMYVDGFVDMAMAGKLTGKNKALDKGRQVYAFAAGSKKLYDYVDRNPDVMAAPVDYTNDVRVLAQLDNFISINNAIDLDLFGQVNAESAGLKHISGTGGQLDFVMGAYLSKGGKSFICLSSTVTGKDGTVKSRIVPTLTPGSICTDPRSCVHYIVTEYGMVNLKGLSTWERAEALISIAHPDFREQLIQDAEKMHIWRRSNK
ncbi:butyryl-CoA:acetate CoA-transferase [Pseudoflavonifractor phocaeensis]|jgi:butyryl-CoA:acetate CoA-transferase|uniref:butyryl-CoA:acetate CoA-transferase n=1 Tax=Pseudoflavonifractor phocaeensis TaxID=1870988 RepID=UPI0025A4A039|nr:butyryl-CoA:acetate CoA-transferase [Pseudoflavonifractor phocaeensis]MDM8238363.1 butyryl-CoA:acetate CoA-transferase [Pseudoflavonifractor phocaeensis]